MKGKRYWEIGGFIAGGVLILFGVVAIFLGVNGYNTTRDDTEQDQDATGDESADLPVPVALHRSTSR